MRIPLLLLLGSTLVASCGDGDGPGSCARGPSFLRSVRIDAVVGETFQQDTPLTTTGDAGVFSFGSSDISADCPEFLVVSQGLEVLELAGRPTVAGTFHCTVTLREREGDDACDPWAQVDATIVVESR